MFQLETNNSPPSSPGGVRGQPGQMSPTWPVCDSSGGSSGHLNIMFALIATFGIEWVVTFECTESLSQNYISFLKVHLVIRNRILSNSNLLMIDLKVADDG